MVNRSPEHRSHRSVPRTSRRTRPSKPENCVELCDEGSKTSRRGDVYGVTSRRISIAASCATKCFDVGRCSSPESFFQACSVDHSDISPFKINDLQAVLSSLAQNAPSNVAVPPCDFKSAIYPRRSG
jgi:hypothetical protein